MDKKRRAVSVVAAPFKLCWADGGTLGAPIAASAFKVSLEALRLHRKSENMVLPSLLAFREKTAP
jgi:hypothetical protein